MKKPLAGLMVLCLGSCAVQSATITVLVADRTAHKVWRLTDLNGNGTIETNEVFVWFDGANAAGTPGFGSLAAFNARSTDNLVAGGDVTNTRYYTFQDLNGDGDAMDAGESRVCITTSNQNGASMSAPTGIGFMTGFGQNGDMIICNSGNTSSGTPDAMYRCHDYNNNGSYDDLGDITPWVTTWPGNIVGNSNYVPFEIVVDPAGIGYLRSSGTAAFSGVYRFIDNNLNGRADDAGEFTSFFDSTNQSGITLAAGFSMERNSARPNSFYTNQGPGGVDQIIRLTDGNHDGDANDAGEAVVVYSTAEASFTLQDVLYLTNGDVLASDIIGKKIIRLHDANTNGIFEAGERTDFFVAGAGPVLDTRQLALVPSPLVCGTSDFDGDGDAGTDFDIQAFFACLGGDCCALCFAGGSDFNGDGDTGTDADIESFFRVLGGGAC